MRIYDIIEKKKKGLVLTEEDIDFFVKGVTDNTCSDSQVGAMLMAICQNGMDDEETFSLVKSMANSGETVDLSSIEGTIVDKHSSGGVSDSTTLIVSAIMMALGAKVAKMSGRGLGHTGGTIDKLESFSGYKVEQSHEKFLSNVKECGGSIIAQTANLAPADKRLYAIRDITATINSIPLIASSIMSKKIASGVKNLVLDVKYGDGAFMKTPREAVLLAKKMVSIAQKFDIKATALVTNMQYPLGNNIGCNLEMQEVIDSLQGKSGDLLALSKIMCEKLLLSTNLAESETQAKSMIDEVLENKKAFDKLKELIAIHGGDTKYFGDNKFKKASFSAEVLSESVGKITNIHAKKLGEIVCSLGGGRTKENDNIAHEVGIEVLKRVGDDVVDGEAIARVYALDEDALNRATQEIKSAVEYDGPIEVNPLVYACVVNSGIEYDENILMQAKKENAIMEYDNKLSVKAEEFKLKHVVASIEHTNLSQTATADDIRKLCREAYDNGFHGICVQPSQVTIAKNALISTPNVKICTVVGFPYGEVSTDVKVLETRKAVKTGASEIDMVLCVSKLKQNELRYVIKDISKVVKAARNCIVKVIIEASLLTETEMRQAVDCVVKAKAHFVKTSTGLFGIGATIKNLEIITDQLKKYPESHVQIKASGGIKTLDDIFSLLNCGAVRIGTSSSLSIVSELKEITDKAKEKIEKEGELAHV